MYCKRNFDWEELSFRTMLEKTGKVRYIEIMFCAKAHTFMVLISFIAERKQCLWFSHRSHMVMKYCSRISTNVLWRLQHRSLFRTNVGNRGRCYCAYAVLCIMSEKVRVNFFGPWVLGCLGCCTKSLGDWWSTFRDSVMVSSWGIRMAMKKVF